MSNKKISELTFLNALSANGDVLIPAFDVESGETVKVSLADIIGTSVGDVKSSMLTPSQFSEVNFGTWLLMDGQSCVGTPYATLTGNNTVPNMVTDGTFLRQAKSGRTLGSFESEDFKSHTHTQTAHTHTQTAHGHVAGHGRAGPPATFPYSGGLYGEVTGTAGRVTSQDPGTYTRYYPNTSSVTAVNQNTTAVNQNTGGTETRPNNTAINYFIRVS